LTSKSSVDRQAEIVDVQLLDVLAQVESVLRHGREIQREALRVRGVPAPVSDRDRRSAGTAIRKRVDEMQTVCTTLCTVVDDLRSAVRELERLLSA
jgi:hypothetical protein